MNLADIIALTRAGYKKKDIDAIIASESNKEAEPEVKEAPTPVVFPYEPIDTEDAAYIEEATEEATTTEPDEPTIDYKSLYEKSQAELKAAQSANIRTPINNNEESDEDYFNRIVQSL